VKEGLPFRTAHKIVGNLVHAAHKSGKSLSELSLYDIGKEIKQKEFDAKKLAKIISSTDAVSSLKSRSSHGSSGILQQKKMIASRTAKIRKCRASMKKRTIKITSTTEDLARKVRNLTK
jgi:argininosuccinate lyase